MSYRKETYYTDHDKPSRVKRTEYIPKHTEHLPIPSYHHSRSTDPDRGHRRRPSRPRRTATGYINRRSCPSYPYIITRSRSPDHSISQRLSHSDEYIQSCEPHHDRHAARRPRDGSNQARWKVQAFSSKAEFMRAHGLDARVDEDLEDVRNPPHGYRGVDVQGSDVEDLEDVKYFGHRSCSADTQGSDVEDIAPHRASHELDRREHDSDHESGSDIVSEKRRSVGSHIASLPSRRSSYASSDPRWTGERSRRAGSDVQERRESSDTDSEYEDGYISLDDHIGGGSDCVSNRSLSEDGGEGSDAVSGCEMEEGSDVADASDVEDFDEGEDCILDTHVYDRA